jgi:hypothetical protein
MAPWPWAEGFAAVAALEAEDAGENCVRDTMRVRLVLTRWESVEPVSRNCLHAADTNVSRTIPSAIGVSDRIAAARTWSPCIKYKDQWCMVQISEHCDRCTSWMILYRCHMSSSSSGRIFTYPCTKEIFQRQVTAGKCPCTNCTVLVNVFSVELHPRRRSGSGFPLFDAHSQEEKQASC